MNLYITDLDGTLFNDDGAVSKNSIEMINRMVDDGLQFSVATARSSRQVQTMLSALKLNVPIVIGNGMAIYDLKKKQFHNIEQMNLSDIDSIIDYFCKHNIPLFLAGITEDNEDICYYTDNINAFMVNYINRYCRNDDFYIKVDDIKEYKNLSIKYICKIRTIGKKEDLEKLQIYINNDFNVTTYLTLEAETIDVYGFEVLKEGVNKGKAIEYLKDGYNYEKLICFGNDENDFDMIKQADVGCVVSNGLDKIKNIATQIIGNNNDDAVATYIENSFYKK